MQYNKFAQAGFTVSRLSIGTATFGKQVDEAVSLQILDRAADAGINLIDIPDFYPMGADPSQLGVNR